MRIPSEWKILAPELSEPVYIRMIKSVTGADRGEIHGLFMGPGGSLAAIYTPGEEDLTFDELIYKRAHDLTARNQEAPVTTRTIDNKGTEVRLIGQNPPGMTLLSCLARSDDKTMEILFIVPIAMENEKKKLSRAVPTIKFE